MKKAVYAGSFDPFTIGHLQMVRSAAELFDSVVILVAVNSKKKRMFDKTSMALAIDACLHRQGIDNTEVVVSEELTADVCSRLNAGYLVRGLRNTTDYMYEEEIAKFNQRINPGLKTVYLRAVDDDISSSMVRELHTYGKPCDEYVPSEVLAIIKQTE